MISNFSLMDAEKLDHLARRGVNLCASWMVSWGPDDNRKLLGAQPRPSPIGSACCSGCRMRAFIPGWPLQRNGHRDPASLAHREIVDDFWRLGLARVQLGPISLSEERVRPGVVLGSRPRFLIFYRRAMDRILLLAGIIRRL